jgi:hypothetical protein
MYSTYVEALDVRPGSSGRAFIHELGKAPLESRRLTPKCGDDGPVAQGILYIYIPTVHLPVDID